MKEKLLGFGAAISSLLAMLCWVGPVIFLSLGLGGIGLASLDFLAPYRPLFVILAAGSLYFAHKYMEKGTPSKLTKIAVWVSTVFVFIFMITPMFIRFFL